MPSVWAAILAFRVKDESGTALIASLPMFGREAFLFIPHQEEYYVQTE